MSETPRVVGIDTSLRSTGIGVVEAVGSRIVALAHETVSIPQRYSKSECLLRLSERVRAIVQKHNPTAVAIEGVFFCRNVRTAISLGEARGTVIACCAEMKIPAYEYEPRRVKQAVVGNGAASKEQVQHMVTTILALSATPPEDESDALAIAICHLHNMNRPSIMMPDTI